MKRVVAVLVAVAVVHSVLAVTWASPARKYEGKTMSIYEGISPLAKEDIVEYIAPRLKEKYGLDLAIELLGSTTMVEKLVVMRQRPRISIAGWDEPVGKQACEMGLCAPLNTQQSGNLVNLYPWALDKVNGNIQVIAKGGVAVGLIYNKDEFSRGGLKPPTSWLDLWRGDLTGRVSFTAPESTWGLESLVMLARLGGGNETNIEPGFVRLKTLLPHIQSLHTWSSELAKLLQLGQVWMATTGSNMGPALAAQGLPVEWIAPREGAPMINGGMSVIANAPYQDAAADYVNLYMSPEYQALRARHSGLFPTNIRAWALMSPQEKKSMPIQPDGLYKLMQLDWDAINKSRAAWVERWHKEIQQ